MVSMRGRASEALPLKQLKELDKHGIKKGNEVTSKSPVKEIEVRGILSRLYASFERKTWRYVVREWLWRCLH
jgi:hypothetical protein